MMSVPPFNYYYYALFESVLSILTSYSTNRLTLITTLPNSGIQDRIGTLRNLDYLLILSNLFVFIYF